MTCARRRKLNWRLRSSIEALDPAAFTETNKLFHEMLFGKCPNKHLLALVGRNASCSATAAVRPSCSFPNGR